jgi:hypothetical protein
VPFRMPGLRLSMPRWAARCESACRGCMAVLRLRQAIRLPMVSSQRFFCGFCRSTRWRHR